MLLPQVGPAAWSLTKQTKLEPFMRDAAVAACSALGGSPLGKVELLALVTDCLLLPRTPTPTSTFML